MSKKKKSQLTNKQIALLSVCILCAGAIMLAASIMLSPSSRPVTVSKTPVEAPKEQEQTPAVPAPVTENPKNDRSVPEQAAPAVTKPSETKPADSKPADTEPAKPAETPKTAPKYAAGKGPRVVIILDDGGHNLSHLKPFLSIKYPLTVAVLPQLAHSVDAAKQVRAAGKSLMLHQPMQAVNLSVDPGPGAITPEMDPEVAAFTMLQNIGEIGPVDGVNNHEGSLITTDENIMRQVMLMCDDNGIFFLDSRTNSASVCRSVAKELGMKLYERDIFLDNEKDAASMTSYFKKGLEVADKKGSVVMIGHVWSSTTLANVLKEQMDLAAAQGYQFTTVDKL